MTFWDKTLLLMIKNITTDDLILYIYNELSRDDKSLIENALNTNDELQKEFNELVESIGLLEKPKLSAPHPTTLSIIFESVEQNSDEGILEY